MYLLIFLEFLLVTAIIMMFIMKRRIASLMRENVMLHEKIYQLRNKDNEKDVPDGNSDWKIVEPSELVFSVKVKDITRMN